MKFGFRFPAIRGLPVRFYVVIVGVFFLASAGWVRFVISMINWNFFVNLGVMPGVWYLAVQGLITGLVYTLAGIVVIFQISKWKTYVMAFLITGLMVFWIDRIYFAASLEARSAMPYSLVFSAGLTMIASAMLLSTNDSL